MWVLFQYDTFAPRIRNGINLPFNCVFISSNVTDYCSNKVQIHIPVLICISVKVGLRLIRKQANLSTEHVVLGTFPEIQLKKQTASLKFAPEISCLLCETCLVVVSSFRCAWRATKLLLRWCRTSGTTRTPAQFNACVGLSTLLILWLWFTSVSPARCFPSGVWNPRCLDKHNQP